MAHSYSREFELTCPECGAVYRAPIWLIVDGAERRDLLSRASESRLHRVSCPNDHAGEADAPLLVYLPGRNPPLFFSPAPYSTAEQHQDEEQARDLLNRLKESLGTVWDDSSISEDLIRVPRRLLPVALIQSVETALSKFASHTDEGMPVPPELQTLYREAEEAEELNVDAWEAILNHFCFTAAPPQFRIAVLRAAARSLFRRNDAGRRLPDLDQALAYWRRALELVPRGSPDRAKLFFNIGVGLGERYVLANNVEELREAIRAYQRAAKLIPLNSPDLPECFNNLGTHLAELYAHTRDLDDLQAAIRACLTAVNLSPTDSADRATRLSNLGSALQDCYGRTCDLNALQKAVAVLEEAVDLTSPEATSFPGLLNNLGTALSDRYAWFGEMVDMENAVRNCERAIDLTPKDSPNLSKFLTNAGNALNDRYCRAGNLADLEAAISNYQRAVDLDSRDSPDFTDYLHNLAAGLRARYRHTGNPADLKAAIRISRQIDELATLRGAANLPSVLTSRGNLLSDCYVSTGTEKDLNGALLAYQKAIQLTPEASPQRAEILSNFATSLQERYDRTGDLEDLHEAIRKFQQAVNSTPEGSPQRPGILNNLGAALMARYHRTDKVTDLNDAVAVFHQVVDLTPENAPDRPLYLDNLGSGLHALYVRTRTWVYLDNALLASQQALTRTPEGSPDRPARWNNVGTGFRTRYDASNGDLTQLQQGLAAHQKAVDLTAKSAPDRPLYLINLATALRERSGRNRDAADRKKAISAYRQACRYGLAVAVEQALTSSRYWGEWALDRHAWKEAAEAYGYGLKAIETLFHAQFLRASKESWLRDAQGLHSYAAYACARRGDFPGAVLALEQGSARMLSEALALDRADLQALEVTRPDLAARYRGVARRLLKSRGTELRQTDAAALPDIERLRADRSYLEALIGEIRRIEGYGNLLRPPEFAHVQAAAASAFLVYLAVTPVGGLALLVDAEGRVTPIWRDALTEAALRRMLLGSEGKLEPNSYLGAYGQWRSGRINRPARDAWRLVLDRTTNWLWQVLMGELVRVLTDRGASRAVLIPQGLLGLLPLHAAWIQDSDALDGRRYALDRILFTYAPNALALLACQARAATLPADTLFAVEDPDGSLRFSPDEVRAALKWFQLVDGQRISLLGGPPATLKAVLKTLVRGRANVLHFAAHGKAGAKDPLDAGLTMAHGKLTLRQILRLRLEHVRLAVLSACETGIPGAELPDEIVSLPTGLLQAGVAGVVGSLWAVDDRSTTVLMRRFYELWRGKAALEPAEALRQAQLWMRQTPPFDSLYLWASFGYTGI